MKNQKNIPEKVIKNQIMAYLKHKGIYCWVNDSVGIFDQKRMIYRKNKSQYKINGTSDIIGILNNGIMLCIEVKSKVGYPSEDQKLFIKNILNNNGHAFVARSIEDVIEYFREKNIV